MEKPDIRGRSYEFALRIIRVAQVLARESTGKMIGGQLLRPGTSIGANVEEATSAFSKNDFIFKMNTALKEARETNYWLRLIRDASLLPPKRLDTLLTESEELMKILGAIVRTSKRSHAGQSAKH